ncbi:unnamed protein product [Spodoptera exigua]|nr:unnamed protein product [Spodoptera exigua]
MIQKVSPFDLFANSDSQSDEGIEGLLSEYQHHLEKAHKQRKNYLEKSNTKNKVPPLPRHDQFSKAKTNVDKHDDFVLTNSFYNPTAYKLTPSFNNPLDVFIPINSKGKYMNKQESTIDSKGNREEYLPFENIVFNEKKIIDLPPILHKSSLDPIKSSCYCKSGHIPCDCGCKQCVVRMDTTFKDTLEQLKMHSSDDKKKSILQHLSPFENTFKKSDYINDENMKDMLTDNALNIRIKIDLQLPKPQEILSRFSKIHNHDRMFDFDDAVSNELNSGVHLPFPYFNFPVPMELLGYKRATKYSKDESSSPVHKITIHKKKKSRANNNNKKHRKKVITFHNIKVEQQPLFPNHFNETNSDTLKNDYNTNTTNDTNVPSSNVLQLEINSMINKTDDILNETQTEESIYWMVNITNNNSYNGTEDGHKIENSIETDFPKKITNTTSKLPSSSTRKKRDISIVPQPTKDNISKDKSNGKKADKNILSDAELLYWPSVTRSKETIESKSITTLILENEHKKSKINMSKDIIHANHTRVLEQAIFGNVDWDDVEAVAPAFMSFVGKYIRGVLTFCSHKVCHSMKCANKTCLHRVCRPSDRLNNRGHCAGTNSTDSLASMESIMDLPSNIAFEIVDILQNKMLGKIFGKATFCINAKCITLAASKKNFVKSRCSIKELNAAGHCSNAKTVKIMTSVLAVAMLVSKIFTVLFILCSVQCCICKPTIQNELTEGRSIMTSIWGWITYPFYWWSSGEVDQPVTEKLLGSTTLDPNGVVDIRSHNVTIWCNDQTCTTMKCDQWQCKNITCNIYDTDFRGECREYNIITESEPSVTKTPETTTKVDVPDKTTTEKLEIREPAGVIEATVENETEKVITTVEQPLELEAVMSSTIDQADQDNISKEKVQPASDSRQNVTPQN